MFLETIAFTFFAFLLFYAGVKLLNHVFDPSQAKVLASNKVHNWKSTQALTGTLICSVCQILVTTKGFFCGACGYCAHTQCKETASQKLVCKTTSQNTEVMRHQWMSAVVTNTESVCEVCEEDCDDWNDMRCCWCWRTVHQSCHPRVAEVCDFGRYRPLVVPPISVHLARLKNRRREFIKTVTPPPWKHWTPLIVIANAKSGCNDAGFAASRFAGYLNPAQVVEVSPGRGRMESALDWCSLLPEVDFRVLVIGGDGTVAWVLNTLYSMKMKIQKPPAVAILPFGTGNDLSRVLGWGAGTECSEVDIPQVLDNIMAAKPVLLDRWCVRIQPKRSNPLLPSLKEMFMYNYAGFGVDAQVTLNFHETRKSRFYPFNSRIFNKLMYVGFGTGEIIEKTYKNLQDVIDVYLDGVLISLPAIEGIVILNIDSYGAGMHLWEMGNETNPDGPQLSMSDHKLEVVAFYSSFHMGGLQMGVGLPHRVGQAKSVRITIRKQIAVQVDGEPWNQPPAEFIFKAVTPAAMLKNLNAN